MVDIKTAATAPPPKKTEKPEADDPLNLSPHSVEAEEATLGSILMDPEAIHAVRTIITADDFFILRHGWIFDALVRLADRNEAMDTRTVAEDLRQHGQLEEIGGEAYLVYLPNTMPTALHAEVYARLVSRAARRRRLLGAAGEIAQLAHDQTIDIEEVMDQAEASLFNITEQYAANGLRSMTSVSSDYYDEAEILRANGKPLGLPTGLTDYDDITGGLYDEDLLIVAGRPGMGKTAYLMTLIRNVAYHLLKTGEPGVIAFFSLEMGADQLYRRLISQETGIPASDLRDGKINDEEWSRVVEAIGRLAALPIFINDGATLNPLELRTQCRRLKREHGLRLVVVDYAQLMDAGAAVDKRANNVVVHSYISRKLKGLARELRVPVTVAAQLNRKVEERADKRPQLSDLRESGSYEQDADVVSFLYRDEVYNDNTDRPNEADVIVAKHRNGPTGIASLVFKKSTMQFMNLKKLSFDQAADWLAL